MHIYYVKILFEISREAHLKLKDHKCNFLMAHIQHLGHLISIQGIEQLPEKSGSVREISPPRNPKEIKQFLGLVGYHWKFIPHFEEIARQVTSLTKKGNSFHCNKLSGSFPILKGEPHERTYFEISISEENLCVIY